MTNTPRRPRLTPSGKKRPRWVLALSVVVLLLVAVPVGLRALGDVSTGTQSSSAELAAEPNSGAAGAASRGARADAPAAAPARPGQSAQPADSVDGPKIARTAQLGLAVADLTAASGQVRSIGSAAGGSVSSEYVMTNDSPPGAASGATSPYRSGSDDGYGSSVTRNQARMTLSVPAEKLDGVLTDLAGVGTVSYRSSRAEDVTDSYVDTKARLAPARASVSRIQALLADATDLKQVVLIESELSKRQADLDSLTQRLARLDQRTTMSEVNVTLWTEAAALAASDNAFVDSLRTARDGLLTSISVITTGLAVLLPWLVVLGLLGWVALRVLRRRTSDASPTATISTPAAPTPTASAGD